MGREIEKDKGLTYSASGVDIDAAGRTVDLIKSRARGTFRPEVLTDIGGFGGLFRLSGYRDPVLVSSVDGVGTKVKVAISLDRHDTIGADLVNHCVNDIFTCGAEPLFFLDYISVGRLVPEQVASIVGGLTGACSEAGCSLIGGETAEMPGLYRPGDYDLVGFIVGVVEKDAMIDTGRIAPGDVLVGLPSSGLHTNGYSLARRVFGLDGDDAVTVLNEFHSELGCTLGEKLLETHVCYYRQVKPILRGEGRWSTIKSDSPAIKGLAHITGGGLVDNVVRILPPGVTAHFRTETWQVPPIFRMIQERGPVEREEMFHVFNMGIGMVLVCSREYAKNVVSALPGAVIAGEVVKQEGGDRVVVS